MVASNRVGARFGGMRTGARHAPWRSVDLPLSGGLSSPGSGGPVKFSSPLHLHKCMSGTYRSILAVVPPCAGECRFVRVIPVLIFPGHRTCVGFVLATNLLINSTSNTFRGGSDPRLHSCQRPAFRRSRGRACTPHSLLENSDHGSTDPCRRVAAEEMEDFVRLLGACGRASDGSGDRGGD